MQQQPQERLQEAPKSAATLPGSSAPSRPFGGPTFFGSSMTWVILTLCSVLSYLFFSIWKRLIFSIIGCVRLGKRQNHEWKLTLATTERMEQRTLSASAVRRRRPAHMSKQKLAKAMAMAMPTFMLLAMAPKSALAEDSCDPSTEVSDSFTTNESVSESSQPKGGRLSNFSCVSDS